MQTERDKNILKKLLTKKVLQTAAFASLTEALLAASALKASDGIKECDDENRENDWGACPCHTDLRLDLRKAERGFAPGPFIPQHRFIFWPITNNPRLMTIKTN